MTLKPFLSALVLTLAGAGSLSAATLTFELKETGSGVVLTTSGSLSDETPWTYSGIFNETFSGVVSSSQGGIGVAYGLYDVYTATFTAPNTFGSGSLVVGDSFSGDNVAIVAVLGQLAVPTGYLWGSPLANAATFSGASFASLGVTDGSYYSWSIGNDEIELKIGDGGSAVPETGTTLAGLALALAGLVTLRQRAGRRGAAEA